MNDFNPPPPNHASKDAEAARLHRAGLAQARQGRHSEALALIGAALVLAPNEADMLVNHGNVLILLGRPTEALVSYDRALALRPDADACNNRGHALEQLRRPADALESYGRTLLLRPQDVPALFRCGVILGEMGRNDEAMTAYSRLLALQPDHAEALNNRGFLWWLAKQDQPRAVADLEKALAAGPDLPWLGGAILHLKMYGADWNGFEQQKAQIEDGVRQGRPTARPFMFQAVSDNPADLQACARLYARGEYPQIPSPPHDPATRQKAAKIRLGYLSGEFRQQATAILMARLYELHDRESFEVIAIDNGVSDGSAMRARLEKTFDRWIDIAELSDDQAAAAIRDARIDILVNLNGYFGKHRMGVFARRPAPLQVNYLGFPATLGAPYIDYILADRIVIPDGEQRFYDEQVVLLPGSYQPNDNHGRAIGPAPSRAEAGLPLAGFVFCNFNQSYKLTPQTFAGWMRILKQVDGSVLWLLEALPPFAHNLAREAERHGVSASRILYAANKPPAQHLARLKLADLFLDTLPYNAHTTASDALWAGVPVLTRRGAAFAGRVAASLLVAAGVPELICESADDYEALAIELARDGARLQALRDRLARNRDTCALFDSDRFRRHLESAYGRMWQGWLAGEPAKGFAVTGEPLDFIQRF